MAEKNAEKTLAQKVAERKKFIEHIVNFIQKLIVAKGIMVKREETSSHTHTIWTFDDFAGFYFECEFGMTMFGGNEIKIWHNEKTLNNFVFHIYYQGSLDECKVKEFVQGDWQEDIKKVARNKKRILLQIENKKKREKRLAELEGIKEQKRLALQKESIRLGL